MTLHPFPPNDEFRSSQQREFVDIVESESDSVIYRRALATTKYLNTPTKNTTKNARKEATANGQQTEETKNLQKIIQPPFNYTKRTSRKRSFLLNKKHGRATTTIF